jgi:hypothetical protein
MLNLLRLMSHLATFNRVLHNTHHTEPLLSATDHQFLGPTRLLRRVVPSNMGLLKAFHTMHTRLFNNMVAMGPKAVMRMPSNQTRLIPAVLLFILHMATFLLGKILAMLVHADLTATGLTRLNTLSKMCHKIRRSQLLQMTPIAQLKASVDLKMITKKRIIYRKSQIRGMPKRVVLIRQTVTEQIVPRIEVPH